MTTLRRPLPTWVSLCCLSCAPLCAPVWAQDTPEGRPVQFYAGYSVEEDTNLFRLPDNTNTETVLGRPNGEEQIGITTLGVRLRTLQGLQEFELDANLVDYRYRNFDYLSFTARNYAAAWRWAVTPRLRGNLTSDRKESLNSFADYRVFSVPNQRLETRSRLDAVYEIDGPWRLVTGYTQSKQSNQQMIVAAEDFSSNATDVGVRHDFSSGSRAEYSLKLSDGTYLNRVGASGDLLDDTFEQVDNALRLHWAFTGKSSADLNLTHIKRTHPVFGVRDYSGFNIGAGANLSLTAKTLLSVGYVHALSAYATNNSNYRQTDRLSFGVDWSIRAKILLRLRQEWAQMDYLGFPGLGQSSQRQDVTRSSMVSLSWQPRRRWSFSAALQHLSRGSNLPGLDYTSNLATLSGQFNY